MAEQIILEQDGKRRTVEGERGEWISDLLRREGISIPMVCGGMGRCGKCHVKVNGKVALACRTRLVNGMVVTLPREEKKMAVAQTAKGVEFPLTPRKGLGAAVDIGTTTVVLYLRDLKTGTELAVVSGENAQRPFGGDVISRIQAYGQGNGPALTEAIRGQIQRFLQRACRKAGRLPEEVVQLSVAGNTVMEHLFAGMDPTPIGVAPFTPPALFGTTAPAGKYDILAGEGAALTLAPCVAGYVGGDITVGLLSCGIHRQEKPCLFLDLGTNGEMALGDKNGFLACAVAAGPAFEGGEITCGSTASPGAISKVWLENGALHTSVLGGKRPISICGSGLLDLLAVLRETGAVDASGYLCAPEEYTGAVPLALERVEGENCLWLDEDRTVRFTGKDVRKLQLAKGAVAAGIRTLLEKTGRTEADIDKVYLAGGFGFFLNQRSACAIGLLPPSLESRIESMGNSAGRGAGDVLLSDAAREELEEIVRKCDYLELSGDATFGAHYVESMSI